MSRILDYDRCDPPTQIRIDHVCDLMREMKFVKGRTVRELAKQWGLGLDRCKEITACASKIVRAELADADGLVIDIAATAREILARGYHADGSQVGIQQQRVSVDAGRLLLELVGDASAEREESRPTEIRVVYPTTVDASEHEPTDAPDLPTGSLTGAHPEDGGANLGSDPATSPVDRRSR